MNSHHLDWLNIGQQIGLMLLGIMTAYNTWRSKQRDQKTDKVAVKVEQIHLATDGNLSQQLEIGMVAAMNLALASGKPEHQELARVAEQKYRVHKEQLRKQEQAQQEAK